MAESKTKKSFGRDKVIKWRNKYSGEEGYVKSVSRVFGHFENTFDKTEAKTYSDKTFTKELEILHELQEDINNDFFAEMID